MISIIISFVALRVCLTGVAATIVDKFLEEMVDVQKRIGQIGSFRIHESVF